MKTFITIMLSPRRSLTMQRRQKITLKAALVVAQSQVPAQSRRVGSETSGRVGATASNLATRQADVDFAKLQLTYTVITAPASGTVSKRNIQLGQLVEAGQTLFAVSERKRDLYHGQLQGDADGAAEARRQGRYHRGCLFGQHFSRVDRILFGCYRGEIFALTAGHCDG